MNHLGKPRAAASLVARTFDYDFVVIGGGSGGLAASKEAVRCGAKNVALFDYVRPTIHGSKWGLGGTCVNVGCVPKKLMHYASLMGPVLRHDAHQFGWELVLNKPQVNWSTLVENIQMYIKRLNFSYRTQLRSKGVKYINALACLEGSNEISYMEHDEKKTVTSKYILIAVGGRPYIPPDNIVPGARQYAITSDDLFSLSSPPGKTLVVGASYIALECAGFLKELGFEVKVAVRSILLRGFDQECANKVGNLMKEMGVHFVHTLPKKITKLESKELLVTFDDEQSSVEKFDTVLYATGRVPDTENLNLSAIGVELDERSKIVCKDEQSSIPSIFCVGDALQNGRELTPVAIKAGELLARRLFSKETQKMDWDLIPTTVFTPFEYSCCGLSEEDATKKYGEENLEIFLFEFTNLEISAAHRRKEESSSESESDEISANSFAKLICLKNENLKVVGIHFIGCNAGEIMQGYALALRLGATKADFDNCIGIHPTSAEAFHSLEITKASGMNYIASGGCGGGKCG